VFVTPNRRYVEMSGPGNGMSDTASAIAWMHRHAEEYGGNPERIFMIGYSGGASTAALVATNEKYLGEVGLSLENLRAVASVDTSAFDVFRQYEEFGNRNRREMYAVIYPHESVVDKAAMREHSPLHHVEKGKGIPAFILLHIAGRRDAAVLGSAFVSKLQEAGSDAKIVAIEGKTHASVRRGLGQPGDPSTREILRFFTKHGGPS
jgi:acetyl esterase/lipase